MTLNGRLLIPPRQIGMFAAVCALGLLFTLHFTILVAYLLPNSPITAPYTPLLARYVVPLFEQRWTFFAPTPPMKTLTVIARAKTYDPISRKSNTTDWISVSDPLIEEQRRSRYAPMGLVQLGLSNATIQFINRVAAAGAKMTEMDREKFLASPIPASVDPLNIMALNRTAESSLTVQFPRLDIVEFQVAVAVHDTAKYENRYARDNPQDVWVVPLEWQKSHHVARFCCQAALAARGK